MSSFSYIFFLYVTISLITSNSYKIGGKKEEEGGGEGEGEGERTQTLGEGVGKIS